MIKVKVEAYKHQFFWLELWEELLNIYTIEAHSTPLTNLYCLLDEYQKNYIPQSESNYGKNKKKYKRQIDEMRKSNLGIEKDFIMEYISPRLKCCLNLENLTDEKKKKLTSIISKIRIKEKEYFLKNLFELYKILSKQQEIEIEEFDKIEFLTKIFIAGLLKRKFSWYYLQTRPSIFKNNHFVKGSFQYKLNYLFVNFFKEKEKWDIYFKITLKKDILSLDNSCTNIDFLSPKDNRILEIIKKLDNEGSELENFLKKIKSCEYKKEVFFNNVVEKSSDKNNIFKAIDLSLSTYSKEELIYFFNIFKPIKLSEYDNKNFSKQLTNDEFKEFLRLNNTGKNWEIKLLNLSNQELLNEIEKVKNKLQIEDNILAFIYLFKNGDEIENNIKKIKKQISFLENSNNKIIAIVKDIEASDPNAVQKIAKNHLLRLLNVIRYNSPNITFNLNSIDGNVLLENKNKTILLEKEKHLNYRKNLDFRGEEIKIQLQYIKNCKSKEIENSLQNIMHFYGMYLDAQYDSQKFLSLWIGLEKLCDSQNNIGGTVSKSVSNILALYQLRKLLRNFWHDLERFELSDSLSDRFNISVENKKVNEEELFIAIKNNSTKILEIIREETNSQILFYRLKTLTDIFQSADNLHKYITGYKYEVENSIWRLYAIRNKIAHEAYIDTDLTLHIKQLEYFFKITYNNILHSSSQQKYSSMREIFKEVYDKKHEEIWGYNRDTVQAIVNDFFQNLNINKLKNIINPII